MREFSIATIARLLEVSEESVRRWRIRGRNGVQLAVPTAGDRPGRKGYRVTEEALRGFLARNPSLMTQAMRAALSGEDEALAVAPGAALAGDSTALAETDGPPGLPRAYAVFQALVAEKLAEREDLTARIARVDDEVAVLRTCLAAADLPESDDVSALS